MKKRILAASFAVVMAATLLTGCKVVKIGEEGALTGEVEFNAADSVDGLWDQAVEEITGKAVDLSEVLEKGGTDLKALGEECGGVKEDSATNYNYAVKIEGAKIKSVDKDSFYGTMELEVPGYTGSVPVICEIGKYKSKAVRDDLSFIHFKDFKNQTEWGAIGKNIQGKIDSDVVKPVYDDLAEGATIDIVACFAADKADSISLSPVSIVVK